MGYIEGVKIFGFLYWKAYTTVLEESTYIQVRKKKGKEAL